MGWLILRRWAPSADAAPWSMSRWQQLALAVVIGLGLASLGFFALVLLRIASPLMIWGMLAGLTAAAGWGWKDKGEVRQTTSSGQPATLLAWVIAPLLLGGVGLYFWRFAMHHERLPTGGWDAMGFWNLRAAFLARGDNLWQLALRHQAGGLLTDEIHPAYPLFMGGFHALQWMLEPGFNPAVPAFSGFVFGLAIVILLTASLASRGSLVLGLLGGLMLVAYRRYPERAAEQGADYPLALALLAILVLLERALRTARLGGGPPRGLLLATGLAAGMAPWIKNEGGPILLGVAGVVWLREGRNCLKWFLLGAAPGLAGTLAVKLLADGVEFFIPRSPLLIIPKVLDPSRWWDILAAFGDQLAMAGPVWAHPILLLVLLASVLGLVTRPELKERAWLSLPVLLLFLCDYGAYLITQFDLQWHLKTSTGRLVLQLWPSGLWLLLGSIRPPGDGLQLVVGLKPTEKS
jgi:hypothetical protein